MTTIDQFRLAMAFEEGHTVYCGPAVYGALLAECDAAALAARKIYPCEYLPADSLVMIDLRPFDIDNLLRQPLTLQPQAGRSDGVETPE